MFLYFLPGNLSRGMLCLSYTLPLSPLHNPNYLFPHLFGISGRRRETGQESLTSQGSRGRTKPQHGGWFRTMDSNRRGTCLHLQTQQPRPEKARKNCCFYYLVISQGFMLNCYFLIFRLSKFFLRPDLMVSLKCPPLRKIMVWKKVSGQARNLDSLLWQGDAKLRGQIYKDENRFLSPGPQLDKLGKRNSKI